MWRFLGYKVCYPLAEQLEKGIHSFVMIIMYCWIETTNQSTICRQEIIYIFAPPLPPKNFVFPETALWAPSSFSALTKITYEGIDIYAAARNYERMSDLYKAAKIEDYLKYFSRAVFTTGRWVWLLVGNYPSVENNWL